MCDLSSIYVFLNFDRNFKLQITLRFEHIFQTLNEKNHVPDETFFFILIRENQIKINTSTKC